VNPETLKETTAPSPDVLAEIDAACDRFEAEWRAGGRPRIEAYLAASSERARGGLVAELLRVEIAYRAAQGETLLTQDYTPRFPQHASLIDTLLGRGQAAGPSHPVQAGRYRIEGFLAGGGMGLVYRAHDPDFRRPLAVKVLREEFKDERALVARFLAEARITGQLQHPGIPPVHEIGRLPDGRPFLAMKLIEGRTLADLLAAPRDGADGLARFLPVYEQVCQTLAYAHARGVIHRDLKPANIMVGAFGEVQVMDWGLAKSVRPGADRNGEPNADPNPALPQAPQETLSGPTVPGAVMGTLAFMPPEQARGEVDLIDERSDVFGLGAVLAVVLTGRPPFVADTSESARVKAAQGDVGECFARLNGCGADPDLVALCKRCLAPRPDDRPADAGEVAKAVAALRTAAEERARRAELDRVRAEGEAREALARAAEQRRRRRLLLTASSVVVLVLLAGLSVSLWQMHRAQDERDGKGRALAAEQKAREDETAARQQAFLALRSMTADVVEKKFVQGAVLTDNDRAFLIGIIAQFDAFASIKAFDADSRALRAEGRFRVGTLRYRLGELKEAEEDFDQALSMQKPLAADFPNRPEFRKALANSHNNRAALLSATGRLKDAEKDDDEALSINKQLAADFPSRPEFRQDLAMSHNNRGILLSATGRLKEAEKDYDRALSICKQLAADFPNRPEFRQELARSHNNRGILLRDTGRLKKAEKDYDQAVGIQKQLAAAFPNRPEFRQELARSHNNRGILLRDTGRLKKAEKDYDRALSIDKQLAAAFPNQPDMRNEVAGTCGNLALLHQQQRNWAAAKRLLLEGRPHHLAALKANPTHPTYRQFYRNHLSVMTKVHAGLLEQEDAVRTADTRRDLGWNAPVDAYDAACFLSLCIPIVAKHDKLDDKQRKEAAQFYGDAAMRLLREAASQGYIDVPHMKNDTDLDPLRQRADFKKLAAALRSGPADLTYRGRRGAHDGHVTCVACSPDGRRVLSGGYDRQANLWDVEHNRLLRQLTGHQNTVWTVAFSPDGRRGISGGEDRTLRLWDLKTGQQLQRLEGHFGVISSVAFLPDGRHVISGAWDETARLWDLETAKEMGRFNTVAPVLSLAVTRDGRHVLFGSNDGKLRYWDVRTRTEVRAFPGSANYVEGVALTADGRRALASGADGLVHVYDVASGREDKPLRGHTAKVDCVALSPDGSRVLSCGEDKTVRLWDLATGRELARGHGAHKIRWVAFSADGRHAATACYDGSVGWWALPR
jgi:serine/threonine protein kinase